MEILEGWQRTWRYGIAPQLRACEMEVLKLALVRQSTELCQGNTVLPFPDEKVVTDSSKPHRACGVAYMGWKGRRLETIAQVLGYFEDITQGCKNSHSQTNICHFTSWFDREPLSLVAAELIPEIDRSLALLKSALVAPAARPE